MSGRIVGEVFRYAPADLTTAQRLVLLCLAESAKDGDRLARYCPLATLEAYTGLARQTIKNALSELARRCLIQTQYAAHKGKVQHYRIAELGQHHRTAEHRFRLIPGGLEQPERVPAEVPTRAVDNGNRR